MTKITVSKKKKYNFYHKFFLKKMKKRKQLMQLNKFLSTKKYHLKNKTYHKHIKNLMIYHLKNEKVNDRA